MYSSMIKLFGIYLWKWLDQVASQLNQENKELILNRVLMCYLMFFECQLELDAL